MIAELLTGLALSTTGGGVAQDSTSYCLRGRMADGSYTRAGSLAHNGYALGTRVWVEPAVFGAHRWIVRDRIGWGTQADFWAASCASARAYGRRVVRMRVGWRRR